MNTDALANLEKLLDGPRDNVLLRYSLGIEYLKRNDFERAIHFLEDTLTKDPRFTAAWKNLAKARQSSGNLIGALAAFRQGIVVAEEKGDIQAAKEMRVFCRRLEKTKQEL